MKAVRLLTSTCAEPEIHYHLMVYAMEYDHHYKLHFLKLKKKMNSNTLSEGESKTPMEMLKRFSMLGKTSSRLFEIIKTGFDMSFKLSYLRNNLHKMSKPHILDNKSRNNLYEMLNGDNLVFSIHFNINNI